VNGITLRLAFAQGASGLVSGVATPWFGAWLAWRGMQPAQIGALLAAGMLLRVPIVPLSGIVADARNDRRGMMLAIFFVMLVGFGGLNFATLPVFLFLCAVPANLASGAANPLLESVCVRLANRFGFDYGHVRLWASSAYVFSNVVSGALVSRFGLVVIAPWLLGAAILNIVAVYALPAPPVDHPKLALVPRMRATWAEARELLRSPVFLLFLAAASLDQGSHAFYYAYGTLHWRELGYSGWLIGLLWPLGVFAEIGFMSVSLKLFRRVGAAWLLVLGGASCIVRWTILAFDPPLPFVIFAQFLHGGTFALAHLGAMYFVLQAVPSRLAATAQSIYAVSNAGIVMGIATYVSGPLYAAHGGHAYLLMSAMGLGAVFFALWLAQVWSGSRILEDRFDEELAVI
jgi:MFS transporter, PPP family, 3-phenylpropionic acid transporter